MTQTQTADAGLELTKTRWDEAHRQPRFRPRYPHDQVVRWAFRNFDRSANARPHVLDLGTGAGRHALFLAREGFECTACDLSAQGLSALEETAAMNGLVVATHQCSADLLDAYADNTFDGVLCFGVLYYMPHGRIERTIAEIHRVLRPGGKLLCITRTDKDDRCCAARQTGPFSYQLDSLDASAPSGIEEGLPMVFLPEAEARRMFAAFDITDFGHMRVTLQGFSDDDWIISAVKPNAA